jgi:predicted extracellular nuclease
LDFALCFNIIKQINAPGPQCATNAPILTLSDNYGPMQNAVGPKWYFSSVRSGNTITVEGVVSYAFSKYLILPDFSTLVINQNVNAPPAVNSGRCTVNSCVRIASGNVLNFFTTLNVGGNQARGANTVSEFELQAAKIVQAIVSLKADVITVSELENNYYGNK